MDDHNERFTSLELLDRALHSCDYKEAWVALDSHDVEGIVSQRLEPFDVPVSPRFIHLAGIPGSGKSTYARSLCASYDATNEAVLLISFDEIMATLPGYKAIDCPAKAFHLWEVPARLIGYRLLRQALAKQVSIVFDHSAAHPFHLQLLCMLKEEGRYTLEMHYCDALPEQVVEKVRVRAEAIKRHTPTHLIHERYEILQSLIPKYKETVDTFVELN